MTLESGIDSPIVNSNTKANIGMIIVPPPMPPTFANADTIMSKIKPKILFKSRGMGSSCVH